MESQLLHNVNQVSAVLVRTPGKPGDLTGVLQHIAQTAQEAFATDACVILAFNPITGGFIGSQTVGNVEIENELLHDKPRAEGATRQVLKDGIFLVEDLEVKPQYYNRFTRKVGIHAFAGLAMRSRHRQRPLGVIYLDFKQPRKFSSTDCERFQIFALQASFLLQETWLEHNYEEVARIGQKVNHNLATVGDLFQELQTFVDAVLDDSHTLLLAIYQSHTNTLDFHIREQGHSTLVNRPLQGACQHVIETQESWFIQQLSKEVDQLPFQIITITGTEQKESHIFVPLTLRDISLGVLSIQHPLPDAYGQEDLFILQLLANYISLALHNMRLYNSLNQLNETGQILTQQLESEQTLQATVDKIRDATQADAVILYPYEPTRQRFVLPPRIAGNLYSSPPQSMSPDRPDDIAVVALRHVKPIFAKESATIYTTLHGDVRLRQENFQQREKIRSTAVVPLQVGDESVGVLFINFRQTQRFDATQKKLIDGLAHYAAIAIKNAQEYGTLIRRRMRELEILQNIDRELSRTLELETVLNTLLNLAYEQVPTEEAAILLYNSRAQVLETAAAIGRHAEAHRKLVVPLQETKGITRWAMEQKKPARVGNVHNDPQWREIYIQAAVDTISELDVPLLDGEEVVGIFNFESTREKAFRQEDEDFLLTLAGQAVLAIKNAQAYEREKRFAEEGQVLNEISKEIISQLDTAHIFDLILEKALELTHSTTGNLMIYDSERNDLWMAAERGIAKDRKVQRQGLDQGVVGYVARNKQLLNIDLSQPPWNEVNLDLIPGTRSELAVPMLAGDDLRGVLNVESVSPNNFTESDERLLKGLAGLAVIALQNAQAYEREKRLVAEGQVLNEISKEITSQLDYVHIFDLILEKALELTHSHMGNLILYDAKREDLWMAAQRGVAEDKKGQHQKLGQGIVGYVAKQQQLQNVGNVTQFPWTNIYMEFFPGTRSELAVPMLAGDELRGVLNVESPIANNFSESDERLLQGLADLAVIALQNAQAYEREKRLVAEGQVLNEISKEITSQLDHVRVFDLILEKALILTGSATGTLELYDPSQNVLWMAAERGVVRGKKGQFLNLDQGVVGYVARNKQSLNVDLSQPPWNEIYVSSILGTRSELAVPMLVSDELRGVLNVESPNPNNFNERDERLLQELADLAVIALQNAQAYEREKRLVAEGQVLNEISKEITSQLDHVRVFDLILAKAGELTHSTLCTLWLYDPNQNVLWMAAERGVVYDRKGKRISLDQGIVGHVARNKESLIIDPSQSPWKAMYLAFVPGTRSELTVPMLAGDDLRGVLNIESPIPNNFDEGDERLMKGLADLAVVALQNAERFESARREAQRFELLYQAGQELSKITDLEQIEQAYDVAVQIAAKQSQSQAVIYRYDEMNAEVVLKSASPYRQARLFDHIKLDEGLNGQVAREWRTIVVHDIDNLPPDVLSVKQSDPSMHSLVVTPILFKDQYYGNLGLRHEEVGHFRSTDILFFEGLARELASTIHRLETAKSRQEFEQRALSAEEMSSIGQSAFEVTHRLGNDLGLVELYVTDIQSELEKQGMTNTFVSKKLENILQDVQAVLSFSGDLKQELAKLGAKEEMAHEPVLISPRVLLEEAAAVPTLPLNIEIGLEIDGDVAAVRVFHSLVADILRNLVANAIQAMPEGGKITLRAHNTGRSVALEVNDTGVGIPPQKLSNIFDLFFSTKGSSGFGLWSARRNALKNQGDLKVESKPGQGTTFTLLLPRTNGTRP